VKDAASGIKKSAISAEKRAALANTISGKVICLQ
jgi:hypothetical protein